jgi:hypothetical protein
VDSFLKPEPHDGIISLHTGGGKTVCALYIASQIKMPTLVIVHNTFLRDQWYERVRMFLPFGRVGLENEDKSSDTMIKDFCIRVDGDIIKYKSDITPNFKLIKNLKPEEVIRLAETFQTEQTVDAIVEALPVYTSKKDVVIGMLQAIIRPDVKSNGFKKFGLVDCGRVPPHCLRGVRPGTAEGHEQVHAGTVRRHPPARTVSCMLGTGSWDHCSTTRIRVRRRTRMSR